MSVTFSTLSAAIALIWTKPSFLPKKFTNAPKSITFTTLPSYISPTSGSATILFISSLALSMDSLPCPNIEIKPLSSISIFVSELADISFITFPPDPITSRILSTEI